MKNPLNKLVVETLGEPFYLNIAQVKETDLKKIWVPLWYNQWVGSYSKKTAILQRKDAFKYLYNNGSHDWRDGEDIKTVKVIHYQ